MRLIVGLGNPGAAYAPTRHNIGWRILDALAIRWRGTWRPAKYQSEWCGIEHPAGAVWLLKPQTYMNASGQAVAEAIEAWESQQESDAVFSFAQLLVVTDDVALPLGRIRLRGRGSCGGHNGLASVEAELATDRYARLRVGVGPGPAGADLVEFVLGRFRADEEDCLREDVLPASITAVTDWLEHGLELAQGRWNGWRAPGTKDDNTEMNDNP